VGLTGVVNRRWRLKQGVDAVVVAWVVNSRPMLASRPFETPVCPVTNRVLFSPLSGALARLGELNHFNSPVRLWRSVRSPCCPCLSTFDAMSPVMPLQSLHLTIATRESRLALWQAEHVKALLEGLGHTVTLLGMTTRGDQILDRTLSKVGGKGLFVKELETALEEGRADLAVHSLKDVPMLLPDGFTLACVMEREDPRDAWVSPQCSGLADLPVNAVVGTSSLRRLVLLREALAGLGRNDVRIEPLRGNLDTRLRKLDDGQYQAIVLAAAGLKRLGLSDRIRHIFEPTEMLPAAGQGALGIEIRSERADVAAALAPLAHMPTWLSVAAERAVSRAMGGSCSMPLAAFSQWGAAGQLTIRGAWGEESGNQALARADASRSVTTLAEAEALGSHVADLLCAAGARRMAPDTAPAAA
jgi:hydroxymethylbilane synthase